MIKPLPIGQSVCFSHELLKDGDSSRFVKLIQGMIELMYHFQLHYLPLNFRTLGVQAHLADWKESKRAETQAVFDGWKRSLGRLHFEDPLVRAVQKSVLTTLHQEQEELLKTNPCIPFVSIFNEEGARNINYANDVPVVLTPMTGASEQVHQLHQMFLASKNVPRNTSNDLIEKAAYEALLQFLCQQSRVTPEVLSLLYTLISDGKPNEYWLALLSTQKANRLWEKYSALEKQRFEAEFNLSIEGLEPDDKTQYAELRKLFFRAIFNEQKEHKLPFVSIVNPVGELNEDYQIDLLNSRSKAIREMPFPDGRHLKHLTDCDVVTLNTTEPENISDPTRMREPGSILKRYCDDVLRVMHDKAEKVDPKASSMTDRLIVLQDKCCDLLSTLHFIKGFASRILTHMQGMPLATPRKAMQKTGELKLDLIEMVEAKKEVSFVHTLEEFQNDLRKLRTKRKVKQNDEDLAAQFQIYATSLQDTAQKTLLFGELLLQLHFSLIEEEPIPPMIDDVPKSPKKKGSAISPRPVSPSKGRPRATSFSVTTANQKPLLVHNMNPQNFERLGTLLKTTHTVFNQVAKMISEENE